VVLSTNQQRRRFIENHHEFPEVVAIANSGKSTREQTPNTFYFKLPYIGYFSSINYLKKKAHLSIFSIQLQQCKHCASIFFFQDR